MIKLENRWIDPLGLVVFQERGIMELMYRDDPLESILVENTRGVDLLNTLCDDLKIKKPNLILYNKPTITIKEFDKKNQDTWLIPDDFLKVNMKEFLLAKCVTEDEMDRVILEYKLFEERGMEKILNLCLYMVTRFRENNVLWGIGRGSSVASYCLYLIGIHRIDSLKFNLDIGEFLR